MKNLSCITALLGAILLAISPLAVSPAKAETITIVADIWCPYNCDAASNRPGMMIEIAKKAFAKHNIDIEYSTLPWTRAIEETRQNKHTAIVGAAFKDAPDFVFPAIPQGWMRNSFYIKKGNTWRFVNLESLSSISLGVIADYSYNDEIDNYVAQNIKNPRLVQIVSGDNALDSNFKKLAAGRIGALIEGSYVADYYIAQNNMHDQFEIAGSLVPSDNDNLFIAFSPKNPKAKFYADILAKETQALRESGELQEILKSYNVSDWKK